MNKAMEESHKCDPFVNLFDDWIQTKTNKNLANATFGTSQAFQMREEMRIEKNNFSIFDPTLG